MHLKVVIFALSFLTVSAYPFHLNPRGAIWIDSKSNHAHDKTVLSKDVDNFYKRHLDSSSLYNQGDDDNKNPMAEEMQQKLSVQSEYLRTRLHQELAELRERLSPSSTHLSSTLASMRERLAPLTQQLQSSLSSNTQDLCGQLSHYLHSLETADAQAETRAAQYQEAFHWMTNALEHGSSKMADIINDFHTKTVGVLEHLTEVGTTEEEAAMSELWPLMSSRLGQEVSSLREETQNRVGALKAELDALQGDVVPVKAEVTASVEQFCQNSALQSQWFQVQMEKLFQGLEEEVNVQRSSRLSPPSSSSSPIQPTGSLQEEFSIKLSALLQDILHSV
ncbi:uncharacterized protein zgc:162608 [Solea solea]|uniref:uncharacterized protein zgc:162608 n=1 Tax=Solea solea TaxID=90069 RepID=UPI00272AD63D|nr:uncharacterized protein zgc:162608 [Solea solea]